MNSSLLTSIRWKSHVYPTEKLLLSIDTYDTSIDFMTITVAQHMMECAVASSASVSAPIATNISNNDNSHNKINMNNSNLSLNGLPTISSPPRHSKVIFIHAQHNAQHYRQLARKLGFPLSNWNANSERIIFLEATQRPQSSETTLKYLFDRIIALNEQYVIDCIVIDDVQSLLIQDYNEAIQFNSDEGDISRQINTNLSAFLYRLIGLLNKESEPSQPHGHLLAVVCHSDCAELRSIHSLLNSEAELCMTVSSIRSSSSGSTVVTYGRGGNSVDGALRISIHDENTGACINPAPPLLHYRFAEKSIQFFAPGTGLVVT